MNEQMTVFFNKRTGSIKALVSGLQNMSMYGTEQEDYEMIYDYLSVPFDEYVFANYKNFEVVEGTLKIKSIPVPEQYL